jgi:hypothetical protein
MVKPFIIFIRGKFVMLTNAVFITLTNLDCSTNPGIGQNDEMIVKMMNTLVNMTNLR